MGTRIFWTVILALLSLAFPVPALAEGLSLGGSFTTGLEFNLNSPYAVADTAAVFDGRLTQPFGERGALAVRLDRKSVV